MSEHKIELPAGTWLVWLWISACLVILAVIAHTQAPLVALNCPYNEQDTTNQSAQENCAAFDILFARSAADMLTGIGDFIHRNRDDITAASTLAVAIFTATLWWVTWRMVRIAKEERSDTLRAVVAAESAVEATKATERRQLRAYVGIIGTEMHCPSADLEQYDLPDIKTGGTYIPDCVNFSVLNGGQTPAYEVRVHINHWWMPFGYSLTPGFEYLDLDTMTTINEVSGKKSGPIASSSTIMPGREEKFNGSVTVDLVKKARSKEVFLYFYGHIDYVDVFRENRRSEFCYLYVPNWSGEGESFFAYHEHNKAT